MHESGVYFVFLYVGLHCTVCCAVLYCIASLISLMLVEFAFAFFVLVVVVLFVFVFVFCFLSRISLSSMALCNI